MKGGAERWTNQPQGRRSSDSSRWSAHGPSRARRRARRATFPIAWRGGEGGGSGAMAQPTAGEALKRLEPLVGEWTLEAKPPDGPPWPGEARARIEWHDSGAHLVQRATVDVPGAPDSISIMGCDAANGTHFQLYSAARGVCRIH